MFKVTRAGEKDSKYRRLQGLEQRTEYVHSDCGQSFPFPGSLIETYRFLGWAANNLRDGVDGGDSGLSEDSRTLASDEAVHWTQK